MVIFNYIHKAYCFFISIGDERGGNILKLYAAYWILFIMAVHSWEYYENSSLPSL